MTGSGQPYSWLKWRGFVWAARRGEDGYLRVMRDIPDLKTGDPMSNGLGGVCGVASGPSFPEPFQG
jgi:hypothetical protein